MSKMNTKGMIATPYAIAKAGLNAFSKIVALLLSNGTYTKMV